MGGIGLAPARGDASDAQRSSYLGFALALFAPAWFILLISSLTFPWNSWLLIALGMLIAVVVAL